MQRSPDVSILAGTDLSVVVRVLVKVKPIKGRSLPVRPVDRLLNSSTSGPRFSFSKSSKLDVSSLLVTVGMNGGLTAIEHELFLCFPDPLKKKKKKKKKRKVCFRCGFTLNLKKGKTLNNAGHYLCVSGNPNVRSTCHFISSLIFKLGSIHRFFKSCLPCLMIGTKAFQQCFCSMQPVTKHLNYNT